VNSSKARAILVLIAQGICATVLAATNEDITVTASNTKVYADSGGDSFSGTTIPTHVLLNAVDGDAYNKTTIDWYENPGQTILSHDFDQRRTGAYQSNCETDISPIELTATSNEPYKISGYYNVTDFGATGSSYFYVQLIDDTTNRSLYYFVTTYGSGTAHNAHFNLPATAPSASLIAGHEYELHIATFLFNSNSSGNSGASAAVGHVAMVIGAAIPEPATIVLFTPPCGALTLIRRRRHR
jgi:hypothetical protein